MTDGDLFAMQSNGTIGEYNATTGRTINASLITGLDGPNSISASNGEVYVVLTYDEIFGASALYSFNINSPPPTPPSNGGGIYASAALVAASGSDVYVADFQYSILKNGESFITGVGSGYSNPDTSAMTVSGNNLYVASTASNNPGWFDVYNATTGAL